MRAFTPTGLLIVASCETVLCAARLDLDRWEPGAPGNPIPAYAGGSDIDWDSQEARTNCSGARLYLDETGHEWPETELILFDSEELPMWVDRCACGRLHFRGTRDEAWLPTTPAATYGVAAERIRTALAEAIRGRS